MEKLNTNSFSLIETLVALSLISLLFIISIPNLSSFEKQILKTETEKLFSTIIFLQQKAVASNKGQTITLDLTQNSYSYLKTSNNLSSHVLQQKIKFGVVKNSKGPPSSPKNLILHPIRFPIEEKTKKFVIKFFGDGKISPGTLYLTNKKETHMTAISIPISQVSLVRKYYLEKKNKWSLF